MTGPEHLRARELLEELWRAAGRLGIGTDIARRAGDLADEHALRGYDAVHLASYEAIASEQTILVTLDEDLRRAARQIGFTIAPRTA